MARPDRIAAYRILLAVALEDAATASTMFVRMVALGEARRFRLALANLGVA